YFPLISMVVSLGTLGNNETTSKETNLVCPPLCCISEIFCSLEPLFLTFRSLSPSSLPKCIKEVDNTLKKVNNILTKQKKFYLKIGEYTEASLIKQTDKLKELTVHRSTDRSKKETAKKRHNTGRPEATDDGDKLRNCSIEEKGYENISYETSFSTLFVFFTGIS
ncbi:hypothetical protein L9F63_000225, partial [Diploptera punctata]